MKDFHAFKESVKRAVADDAEGFAAWIFPNGRRNGHKWLVGDISGAPGKSLSVELTGAHSGAYYDFSSGEGGDCIKLAREVHGLDFTAATRMLAERYGVALPSPCSNPPIVPFRSGNLPSPREKVPPTRQRLSWWGWRREPGTLKDMEALRDLRGLSMDGLELARNRGFLWFADTNEGRAWVVTDQTEFNAQGRRLDGKVWDCIGRKKARSVAGACGNWPIGLRESEPFPSIALVEGTPDAIACHGHIIASSVEDRVAVVCVTGAGNSIPVDCLPRFAGKRVRIFVHSDEAGLEAARRWAGQLRTVGATVDGYDFHGLTRTDGEPVCDLADLAAIDPDCWERERAVVESCMAFALEGRVA